MKIVDKKMVDACVKAFTGQRTSQKERSTTSVSFDSKKLLEWIQKVAPHSERIEVRLGKYTRAYAPDKSLAGRTTVFFCACDKNGDPATDADGEELPPANQGDLFP